MRFRRYLGTQYQNKENVYTDKKGKTKPLPIKTIYFLGTKLEHTDAPIIKSIEEKDKALDDNKKTIDELRKKIKSLEG
jgi:hypothetical protein